jgi:hypothetical protein
MFQTSENIQFVTTLLIGLIAAKHRIRDKRNITSQCIQDEYATILFQHKLFYNN